MIFWEMKLSGSNIKIRLYFLKRKLFLHYLTFTLLKNYLYFREQNFLIFQETENLKSFLYLRK